MKLDFVKIINKRWGQIIIFLVWLILMLCNWNPIAWLTGWDNLMPELNPWLNIKRSLNVVWQDYQGLGLLGGMGHGADLVRQIGVALVSIVLPVNWIRFSFHALMLLIGALGAYKLVVGKKQDEKKIIWIRELLERFKKPRQDVDLKIAGLVAGLLYMLNLGTLQNFYTPFEPFSTFFGFLPWLLYFLFKYLESGERKDLLKFGFVSLLATPMGYVQTVFLVWGMIVGVVSVGSTISKVKSQK